MVPARPRAPSPARGSANFYVWADTPDGYPEARDHLQGLRVVELGVGRRGRAVLLAPLLLPPARSELRRSTACARRCSMSSTSGSTLGVDGLRLDAVPYLFEREGTNCENLPETLEFLSDLRRHIDAKFEDRMLLAEANQWPEDAVAYFGNGDRCHMAFHFPLMPRMFMANRMEDRFPLDRHPEPDADDPRKRAVGHVPAEPRRVDPRDGDGRGARLHVPRLRGRPAGAHQPRDPTATGSTARQRPAPDRADERAAVLLAGHPGHLLRRRDRHGGQHLPGRPQRRADADAVEPGPQRRLLGRQPPAVVPAAGRRPRAPPLGYQRRGAAEQPFLAAVVDATVDRCGPAFTLALARRHRVPLSGEPQGGGLPSHVRR